MSMEIINWIIVALFVVELGGAWLWRRNKYPGMLFNDWAVALYFLLIPLNMLFGMLLSYLLLPAGEAERLHRSNLVGLALIGGILSLIALALTAFFRWSVRTDLTEPPK